MADTTSKAVVATIQARLDPATLEAFNKLAAASKKAGVDLENLGGNAGKGLKPLATELRVADRAMVQLHHGALGLLGSMALIHPGAQKAAGAFYALHSSMMVAKGGAALLGGAGGVGALAIPIAAVSAAVVALGSTAVLVSPKLQESLGRTFNEMTDRAELTRNAIAKLQEQSNQFIASRGYFGPSYPGLDVQGQQFAAQQPGTSRARSLEMERLQAEHQASQLRDFPDNPLLEPIGKKISEQFERAMQAITLPKLGREKQMAEMGRAAKDELTSLLTKGPETPAGLLRDYSTANYMEQQAKAQVGFRQSELTDYKRRARIADLQAQEKRLGELEGGNEIGQQGRGLIKEAEQLGWFKSLLAHKPGGATEESREFWRSAEDQKKLEGLRQEAGGLAGSREARQREIRGLSRPGDKPVLEGEGAIREDALAKAQDAVKKASQETLTAKLAIGKATLEELKSVREISKEQEKSLRSALLGNQAKQESLKATIGGMTQRDIQAGLLIGRKLKQGLPLSGAEEEYASKDTVLQDLFEKYNRKKFETLPGAQEYFGFSPLRKEGEQLAELGKFTTEYRQKVEVEIKNLSVQMNKDQIDGLQNGLIPILKDAIQTAQQQALDALAEVARKVALQVYNDKKQLEKSGQNAN